jgi:hypothetical protein
MTQPDLIDLCALRGSTNFWDVQAGFPMAYQVSSQVGRAGLTFLMFLATYVTLSPQLSVIYLSTKNRLHGGKLPSKRCS